jgi:hypothetical protein
MWSGFEPEKARLGYAGTGSKNGIASSEMFYIVSRNWYNMRHPRLL